MHVAGEKTESDVIDQWESLPCLELQVIDSECQNRWTGSAQVTTGRPRLHQPIRSRHTALGTDLHLHGKGGVGRFPGVRVGRRPMRRRPMSQGHLTVKGGTRRPDQSGGVKSAGRVTAHKRRTERNWHPPFSSAATISDLLARVPIQDSPMA